MSALEIGSAPPLVERVRPGIRPLREADLDQLAALYRGVYGSSVQSSPALLKRIFFELPWRDDDVNSLVYANEQGRIIGCLGVMPRRMRFRGRVIRAAVGHHFMVDRSKRGSLAGVELARRFLRGPQELSLAEGNESSRQIWEFLGGNISLLYSLCWTRALRPAQYSLSFLKRRGLPAAAALMLGTLCHGADAALQLIPQQAFRLHPPSAFSDDLDTVTWLACLSAFSNSRSLQPVYDSASLSWLMQTLDEKRHCGPLHKVVVRTHSGRPLGWYLYYLGDSAIAQVVQLGGKEDEMAEVLDHLFHHAWQRGAIAVTGPMDRSLFGPLSRSNSVFHRPDNCWMLMHSHDQQILNAIHAGDAFLSRLEGEWWIAA